MVKALKFLKSINSENTFTLAADYAKRAEKDMEANEKRDLVGKPPNL